MRRQALTAASSATLQTRSPAFAACAGFHRAFTTLAALYGLELSGASQTAPPHRGRTSTMGTGAPRLSASRASGQIGGLSGTLCHRCPASACTARDYRDAGLLLHLRMMGGRQWLPLPAENQMPLYIQAIDTAFLWGFVSKSELFHTIVPSIRYDCEILTGCYHPCIL